MINNIFHTWYKISDILFSHTTETINEKNETLTNNL